jgi:MFS family permease
LLIAGIVLGISFIVFGFSPNYLWVYIIDVIIIGIASNAFYAAQRVLVPDLIELEHRGRVNAIRNYFGLFGFLFPTVLLFIAEAFYSADNPNPLETGKILTQQGHILLLSTGGIIIIICGIIGFIFIRDNISASELPPAKKFSEEFKHTFNIQELKQHKDFFRLIIAQTIFQSGSAAVLPYIFNFIFSIDIGGIGLLIVFIIAGPALIVAIYLLGNLTDKVGRKKIVAPSAIIASIGFSMVPFITEFGQINTILLGVAFGLILIGLLALTVPLDTWSHDLLPEGRKGQFLGIFNIVFTVSQIIGALTAGAIATLLTGVVANPIAWIFLVTPFFYIPSIFLFRRVKETLKEQ